MKTLNSVPRPLRGGRPRLHRNEPVAPSRSGHGCYPDPTALQRDLAVSHGVPNESVLVTAGADAGLDATCRSAGSGRGVILDPDFPRYEEYLANAGLEVVRVPIAAPRFD